MHISVFMLRQLTKAKRASTGPEAEVYVKDCDKLDVHRFGHLGDTTLAEWTHVGFFFGVFLHDGLHRLPL